jgi:hypothetical protein
MGPTDGTNVDAYTRVRRTQKYLNGGRLNGREESTRNLLPVSTRCTKFNLFSSLIVSQRLVDSFRTKGHSFCWDGLVSAANGSHEVDLCMYERRICS